MANLNHSTANCRFGAFQKPKFEILNDLDVVVQQNEYIRLKFPVGFPCYCSQGLVINIENFVSTGNAQIFS